MKFSSLRCDWEILLLFLDLSNVPPTPVESGMCVGLVLDELGREYLGAGVTGDVSDECVLPMALSGVLLL